MKPHSEPQAQARGPTSPSPESPNPSLALRVRKSAESDPQASARGQHRETVYIALGSNLGDRHGYLSSAINMLRDHPSIEVTAVSNVYETAPVGGPPDQGHYLNAAARVETDLSPQELLAVTQSIESALGRQRIIPNGPRTVDIDILFFGDLVLDTPELTLPHPRLHLREFVLRPLADIAPELVAATDTNRMQG